MDLISGPQEPWSNKVVVDGMAWLPKHIFTPSQLNGLRKELTIRLKANSFQKGQGPREEVLYRENDFWFGMPRGYYHATSSRKFDEEVNTVNNPRVFKTSIKPRDEMQAECIDAMYSHLMSEEATEGMMVAGTGVGKTVMSLITAGRIGQATLVIVHMEALFTQWQERILETVGGGLPGVFPDARVGLFRGQREEFGDDYDIVIAMAQTLVNREPDHPIFSWPGTVIVDECHRFGAPTWGRIAPMIKASKRMSCSATPNRKDGGEDIFFHHLGGIVWSGSKPLLAPKVRTVDTTFSFKKNYPKWIEDNILCSDHGRNMLIARELIMAHKAGRKILLACTRLQHILMLRTLLDKSGLDINFGYCTGEWYVDEQDALSYYNNRRKYQKQFMTVDGDWDLDLVDTSRHKVVKYTDKTSDNYGKIKEIAPKRSKIKIEDFEAAKKCDVLLATDRKVAEGFDVADLDTLFVASPRWDIIQLAGRILRSCDDKKEPVVTHFIDVNVPKYLSAWKTCRNQYIDLGAVL